MSNYVDLPINFKRLSPDPLESNVTFNTVSDILNYASTDSTCYPGQICSCIQTNSLYVISSDMKVMSIKTSSANSSQLFALWSSLAKSPSISITSFKDELLYGITDSSAVGTNFPAYSVLVDSLSNLETFISNTPSTYGDINAANCINLRTLDCKNTYAFSLDITNCVKLTSLDCSYNNLPSLIVSDLPILNTVNCSFNQSLTNLTLANLPILTNLNFSKSGGSYITNLSITNCPKLANYTANSTSITQIQLANLPLLKSIPLSNPGALQTINLSNIPVLPNNFSTLNGFNSIANISLSNTPLSSFSITNKSTLGAIDLQSNNSLAFISLKQSQYLTSLNIKNNSLLSSVNVSQCVGSFSATIENNNSLFSASLTSNSGFFSTSIRNNASLTSLMLSGNSDLNSITIENNNLSAISIKNCTNLQYVTIKNEPAISTVTINALLKDLVDSNVYFGTLILTPGVNAPSCVAEEYGAILRDRGWNTFYATILSTSLFDDNVWTDNTIWADCAQFS